MKTIYCKKIDLLLIKKYKKWRIYDYCLYLVPTKDYSYSEIEQRVKEEKDKIVSRLEENFDTRVKIFVKAYPLERLEVKEETGDMILTDKGCLSKKAFLFYL